jgi:hypothetical protein
VTSGDGTRRALSYLNVFPDDDWLSIQGPLVIALSRDGAMAPTWTDGPMLVSLPGDGRFSRQDLEWTSAQGQAPPSAADRWMGKVARLEVVAGQGDWNVSIEGRTGKVLSGTEYGMFKAWYGTNATLADGTTWSGVPLWRFVGLVDGGDARGDGCLNASYRPRPESMGYDLGIGCANGSVGHLRGSELVGPDAPLLADAVNGTALGPGDGPVAIVSREPGEGTRSWCWHVTDITLVPAWDLALLGLEDRTVPYFELTTMPSVSGVAYQNPANWGDLPVRGPWRCVGTELGDLVSMVWNVADPFSVEVIASDGYTTTLTSDEAMGLITCYGMDKRDIGPRQVRAILAYEQDGARWFDGGPLRLMFVNDTGAITDTSISAKYVTGLRVVDRIPAWQLNITMAMTGQGPKTVSFNRTWFEHSAQPGRHLANVTVGGHVYAGIPLWMLVCAVDGNDTARHYEFNDSLVTEGYNVTLLGAGGGTAVTLAGGRVARDDGLILAYLVDGARLYGPDWPLRSVGAGLGEDEMLGGVVGVTVGD